MVASLGVHEHWDNDATKQYSRNLDPVHGKGIELIYLPPGEKPALAADAGKAATPKPAASAPQAPTVLPGKGLAQHDFFYAGEAKEERMFIVRGGEIAWTYTHPGRGEISDAVLQPNGNILFAHQFGVTEITADKTVVWNYDAPTNTEIHTAQPIGDHSVWFIQNGNPAKFIVMNKTTGGIEHQFELPVKNTNSVHGQFRHARLASGFSPVSTFELVFRVFRSKMLALFSRPLLVNPSPSLGATAIPCTPGVSAIWPTTASLSMSMTSTLVPWLT